MSKTSNNSHSQITQHLITLIEAGATLSDCPWHRDGVSHRPTNAQTQARYSGINILTLWAAADEAGYDSGLWATYKQWQALGAQVRRGQTGTQILFYKPIERRVADADEPERFLLARTSRVFAAEQVDGYTLPCVPEGPVFPPLERVDTLLDQTAATVEHGGDRAFYHRGKDIIVMPKQERFIDQESYYAVKLHEFVHWTGATHRCNRDIVSYAFEELVAELGAAFLCADLNITLTPRDDHAGYLASWLNCLTTEPNALARAASLASRAANFICDFESKSSEP